MRSLLVAMLVGLASLGFLPGLTAASNVTDLMHHRVSSQSKQPHCYRWRKVCTGAKRCARWVTKGDTSNCYLCTRHMRAQGKHKAIGRAVTCSYTWVKRLRQRGWHCRLRNNLRGKKNTKRYCVSWVNTNCRWMCG